MKRILTIFFLLLISKSWSQPCTPNTHSLSFNGSSDYVSFPANAALNITNHVTVEAWIYANAWQATSAQGTIICKHGWSAGEGGYVIRAGGNGELSFNMGGLDPFGTPTSWKEVVSPAGALSLNTWTHVAGTFDGDSVNLYINGQLVNTLLFTGTIVNSSTYDLKIGRLSDNQPTFLRYWNGLIDEARVWSRALSVAEIQANMNTQIDPTIQTGLVTYWRLNDGTGSIATDLSSNAIAGTLVGCTWSTNVPFTTGAPPATITPSGNTTFCSGNSVTLNANAGTGLLYLWSNGDTSQSINVTISGTFTVTVTDANNCSGISAPLTVTVNPAPPVPTITFNGTQLICSASSGLQWYFNGNTLFNQVNQYYTPLVNGSYTVIVTSPNGCTAVSAPYIINSLSVNELNGLIDFYVNYNSISQEGMISFEFMKPFYTNISVYDLQGRIITTLLNEELKTGKNLIYFSGNSFQQGSYLIVLKNSETTAFRKFFIIKQ